MPSFVPRAQDTQSFVKWLHGKWGAEGGLPLLGRDISSMSVFRSVVDCQQVFVQRMKQSTRESTWLLFCGEGVFCVLCDLTSVIKGSSF